MEQTKELDIVQLRDSEKNIKKDSIVKEIPLQFWLMVRK